jgi:hypothetical protein
MKKLTILSLILIVYNNTTQAQQAPSEQLSFRLSQRLKDSLSLTEAQRQSIYQINLELHNQKSIVWQQYDGSDSLIRANLQLIENKRDSLYKPLLSDEQYIKYKQKKRSLVSSN